MVLTAIGGGVVGGAAIVALPRFVVTSLPGVHQVGAASGFGFDKRGRKRSDHALLTTRPGARQDVRTYSVQDAKAPEMGVGVQTRRLGQVDLEIEQIVVVEVSFRHLSVDRLNSSAVAR
jgi:hypothetical protein